MNRQRRLDAIARRRALIDSQIQMLSESSNEARIPNIIRNRNRTRVTQPRYGQAIFQQFGSAGEFAVPTGGGRGASTNQFSQLQRVPPNGLILNGTPGPAEGVYLAAVNNARPTVPSSGIPQARQTEKQDCMVPVEITHDIVKKMLASSSSASVPSADEHHLLQNLQTIETEDGTVMVVLDGSNFYDREQEAEAESKFEENSAPETAALQLLSGSSTSMLPSTEYQAEEDPLVEGLELETEISEEESYMIVQTPDGNNVLVPSSTYSQIQEQTSSGEESIIEFVATEGGAIEQLIVKSKLATDTNPTKRRKVSPAPASRNTGGRVVSNNRRPSLKLNVCDSVSKKANGRTAPGYTSSNNFVSAVYSENNLEEEKPRPFRFDLPSEIEERMNEFGTNFITVPIPIKIDSLRSETEKPPSKLKSCSITLGNESVKSRQIIKQEHPSSMVHLNVDLQMHRTDHQDRFCCCGCRADFPTKAEALNHQKGCRNLTNNDTTNSNDEIGMDSQEEFTKRLGVFNSQICQKVQIPVPHKCDSNLGLGITISSQKRTSPGNCNVHEKSSQKHGLGPILVSAGVTDISIKTCDHASSALFADCDSNNSLLKAKTSENSKSESFENENQSGPTTEANEELLQSGTLGNVAFEEENISKAVVIDSMVAGGRRTLNKKASAKAKMFKEFGADVGEWVIQSGAGGVENGDLLLECGEAEPSSLQTARIRATKERIKLLNENSRNKEQIEDNFLNIYHQRVAR